MRTQAQVALQSRKANSTQWAQKESLEKKLKALQSGEEEAIRIQERPIRDFQKSSCAVSAGNSISSLTPKNRASRESGESFQLEQLEDKVEAVVQGNPLSQKDVLHLMQRFVKDKDHKASRLVHSLAITNQLDSIPIVGDHLIRAFASCGSLLEASLVFCKFVKPSAYSWHAIISAHGNHGENGRALHLYYQSYQQSGIKVNRLIYPCILKACARLGDVQLGNLIHDQIINYELETDVIIGSTLIDMYAKCGSIEDARNVFDDLPCRNVVSWNAMLAGYVQYGDGLPALELFGKMQLEGIQPDKVMYLCILKACSCMGSLEQGRLAHYHILRGEIKPDLILGSTLIDMYSTCGSLEDARKVFDDLPHGNVVLLGAMIAGYVQHGNDLCALELFVEMQQVKVNPDKVTFLCVLRACGNIQSSMHIKLLQDQLVRIGLESDLMVANTLINTYCKCESLQEAQKVFDTLKNRDVVSFGVMIAGYFRHGLGHSALELFWRMNLAGIKPDEATFVCSLKASGSIGALDEGIYIHCWIVRSGLELNPVIGTALIDMYAKCRCLKEAVNVFKTLSNQTVVLWTAIITGYAEQGYACEALDMFDEMQKQSVLPDKVLFLCILKTCISTANLERGKLIHCQIMTIGFEADVAIGSTLIDMYAKCGGLEEAQNVFDILPHQNVVTWGVLISGYAQSGYDSLVFELLDKMLQKGVQPDRVIFLCMLKACPTSGTMAQSKLIHNHIIKHGLCLDSVLGNALIDIYGKCGSLIEARNVFDRLLNRDIISWCSVIAAYAESGHAFSALQLFQNMQEEGMEPNDVTLLCVLRACCNEGALQEGRSIHHGIIQNGLGSDVVIGSALIDMYSKCGNIDDAHGTFRILSNHDVVSWSTMMTALTQHGHEFSALELFQRMQAKGIKPNTATFLCILKACGSVGAIAQGQLIHDQIIRSEFYSDSYLGNALVDMYATCGSIMEAFKIFAELSEQDRISWEAMISGFAQHGNSQLAKKCFQIMEQQGLFPHDTTYSSILSACSHGGQVEDGHLYFNYIGEEGEISPKTEHFNCMIDLLGRAGRLEAAEQMLLSMPSNPDLIGWITLLSACKTHGNVDLGKRCFEQVTRHDSNFAAGYVLMSNIYADAQMWEDADGVFELRKSLGAWKKPGQAWIEVENNLHKFMVGHHCHHHGDNMQNCLDKISRVMKVEGYVPQVDVKSELMLEADTSFWEQSEDLAIALDHLPTTHQGTIYGGVQISTTDCHIYDTIISKVENQMDNTMRMSFYI